MGSHPPRRAGAAVMRKVKRFFAAFVNAAAEVVANLLYQGPR